MNQSQPQSGCWYQMPDRQTFRVVTADPGDAIHIQYLDGACEQVARSLWHQLHPRALETPPDESLIPQDQCGNRPDFDALGVAPGTEVHPQF